VNRKIRKTQKQYKIEKYKNNIKNAKTQKQHKIEKHKNKPIRRVESLRVWGIDKTSPVSPPDPERAG
jgi:hypothetical protein